VQLNGTSDGKVVSSLQIKQGKFNTLDVKVGHFADTPLLGEHDVIGLNNASTLIGKQKELFINIL